MPFVFVERREDRLSQRQSDTRVHTHNADHRCPTFYVLALVFFISEPNLSLPLASPLIGLADHHQLLPLHASAVQVEAPITTFPPHKGKGQSHW